MPAASTLLTTTCTIAAGQSLSSPCDLVLGTPRYMITPAAWNFAGGLSLQISIDGTNFFDVFDATGKEFLTAALTANAVYPMLGRVAEFAAMLKIRSGSRERPVPQQAARTFTVVMTK